MVTAKGRLIWVRLMGTTTWDQGRPMKRTSVLQDITEQKLAEATIRESEERWKLALESTGDGDTMKSWTRAHGYSSTSFRGQLEFLWHELNTGERNALNRLRGTNKRV